MKIEIKSWLTGSILFEGDFTSLAVALEAAVKNKTVLTEAVLAGADLTGADLTDADLTGADLTGADLTRAVLTRAVLTEAVLADADLTGADLTGADLTRAVLTRAVLTRAVLTRAVLAGAVLADIFAALPTLVNPDAEILDAIEVGNGRLSMGSWHECETTHCRAGWYVHKSGAAGKMLEAVYGPAAAGALIFAKAYPGRKVPNFYASDAAALKDMKRNAAQTEVSAK